jgi:pyruvate formate lyase activating enzyme
MITDIQRFSLNDGDGIRTTVFFKGCNMACKWCHNPEAIGARPVLLTYPEKCMGCGHCARACKAGARRMENGQLIYDRAMCTGCGACADVCFTGALEIAGRDLTTREIIEEVLKDKPYYDQSAKNGRAPGGITLSGGEVFLQKDLCRDLLKAAKGAGISTGVESCLNVPWASIEESLPYIDLFMFDVKLLDDAQHIKWTGVSNRLILENVRKLAGTGIPLIARTPVIPGATDAIENIAAIAEMLSGVRNLTYYELINYNPLGASKYRALGIPCAFEGARPLTPGAMDALKRAAEGKGVEVRIG